MFVMVFPPAPSGWLQVRNDIKPPDAPKEHPEAWGIEYSPSVTRASERNRLQHTPAVSA